MDKMVFQSPKKHRIISVKKLLEENDIPITSIKLHIRVEWGQGGGREKRNELIVPIEEFNDKLNDAQTFELYAAEEDEDIAIELVESCDEETFFADCVFKSTNYDEVFEIRALLQKNKIPCDDIFPGAEEFLLFVNPENMQEAQHIIARKYEGEILRKRKAEEPAAQTYQKTNLLKILFPQIF
ncbi:MAG: hypothetical protein FWC65_03930 [Treponema sp.]|nr:hypothetical protein [Treponema sp.]